MAAAEELNEGHRLRMRQVFVAAFPSIPEGELDETIVDYCTAMLVERDDDDGGADTYEDEAARGVLQAYLPLGGEEGGASSVLEALDVAGLRARLRAIVADAAAERERREMEARRAASLSLSRSGGGGVLLPEPVRPEGGEEQALGEHDEALGFLGQLAPDADSAVVAYAFRVKCLCDRDAAADLLLRVGGEPGSMAALGEEMRRHEASQREVREARRREQEAAEAAARKAIVDRFADQVVVPGSSSSSSSSNRKGPAPIPLPAPEPESRVRYHQNQRVELPKGSHTKKYLIENVTPEWDGGSRGKIKTKGKRGPGFV